MADQGDLSRALRFAVSQIQPGSGPTVPMNETDRAWLNEVLGEMAGGRGAQLESNESPNGQRTQKPRSGISSVLIGLVELMARENKPHIIDAVKNELQHIADDGELMDRADESDRKNAVAPISALLSVSCSDSSNNTLSTMVAPLCSILAEVTQNSPDCQKEALKLIPMLIKVVKNDTTDTQPKTKALYALSAIVRGNHDTNLTEYLLPKSTNDGNSTSSQIGLVDFLVLLLTEMKESSSARTKAAFLLSCLAEQRHDVRQHLSREYEKHLKDLNENDENIKELIDSTLKRIHTNKSDDENAPPLALAM